MTDADACDLADRSCVPCRGGIPPLDAAAIAPLAAELGGEWRVDDGKRLRRSYKFRDFVGAVAFVNAVTPIAEAEGHHPDLLVRWGEVRAELYTHKIDGLHENDFILAAKMDRAYEGSRTVA
jgi:4a-hydroxytetrahydrobiopterin dehydratase